MKKNIFFLSFLVLILGNFCTYGEIHKKNNSKYIKTKIRRTEGNLSFSIPWQPEKGLQLILTEKNSDKKVAINLSTNQQSAILQKNNQQIPHCKIFKDNFITQPKDNIMVVLKIRKNIWSLYIDDKLQLQIPAVFNRLSSVIQPTSNSKRKPRFQPVELENFQSDFMIAKHEKNKLLPWQPTTGHWEIHTAMEDALIRGKKNEKRLKKVPLKAELSPNFYSLKGNGKEATIITGHPFYDDYSLAAAIQINYNTGGLIFYYTSKNKYYAFTLTVNPKNELEGEAKLWKRDNNVVTTLARARIPLFTNQWYRPKVIVQNQNIICILDGIKIFDIAEPLPAGGKIGLYVDSEQKIQFDDVNLKGIDTLKLKNIADNKFFLLKHDNTFFQQKSLFNNGTPNNQDYFEPKRTDKEQQLIYRVQASQFKVFTCKFDPDSIKCGLSIEVAKDQTQNCIYYCQIKLTKKTINYSVIKKENRKITILEEWKRKRKKINSHYQELMLDLTTAGMLKFYHEKEMVLFTEIPELKGYFGIKVLPNSQLSIRDIQFHKKRENIYRETEQKNMNYAKDPYMRHWASPEGQWINFQGKDKHDLWYKGDFFSAFAITMPFVKTGVLHLAIPEDSREGQIKIVQKDAHLQVTVADEFATSGAKTVSISILPLQLPDKTYTVHYDGYWLWFETNKNIIKKIQLKKYLTGTRARISGYKFTDLAKSHVVRQHLINDYFLEAPYNWIINGGLWQVVNRFQCKPSWSHMAGESADGMAALWQKHRFTGNITLEFYAGMRHGWYSRPGDINCTIAASTTAIDSGYTITCTEWDYNHSQNWSSLYRKGKRVQRSDSYLVPRTKNNWHRKYRNPLISSGRDIHGAWYYIKLRKIGNKIEYYFDNELVFSYKDDEPLPAGLLSVWTLMNSIVVANVKISFQKITPLRFPIKRLPLIDTKKIIPTKKPSLITKLTNHNYPINTLDKKYWTLKDPTGHSRIIYRNSKKFGKTIYIKNLLGAGAMNLISKLPVVSTEQVAGWSFYLRRSKHQPINASFTMGSYKQTKNAKTSKTKIILPTENKTGKYTPDYNGYMHISGTDFSRGAYKCIGSTQVPSIKDIDNPDDQGWEKVTIWLPSGRMFHKACQFHCFGNLQKNAIRAGLGGAYPNDGYEIAAFRPILKTCPLITLSQKNDNSINKYEVFDNNKLIFKAQGEIELNTQLEKHAKDGLNELTIKSNNKTFILSWIQLPKQCDIKIAWHPTLPRVIKAEINGNYPDQRIKSLHLKIEGADKFLIPEFSKTKYSCNLPLIYADNFKQYQNKKTIKLTGRCKRQLIQKTLKISKCHINDKPILIKLQGLTTLWQNYEEYTQQKQGIICPLTRNTKTKKIVNDPKQGRVIEIQHLCPEQTIISNTSPNYKPIDIVHFPVLQFKYKCDDTCYITGIINNKRFYLGEPAVSKIQQIRSTGKLILDQNWHTWTSVASDILSNNNAHNLQLNNFSIGSCAKRDQTGLYTHISLDDFVFGPAIKEANQLKFQPIYFDMQGIKEIKIATLSGLKADNPKQLTWQTFPANQEIIPEIKNLKDGVHHLLIKAVDILNKESDIFDVPFLLDRTPLTVNHIFEESSSNTFNGKLLRINCFTESGSLWDMSKTTISCKNKTIQCKNIWGNTITNDKNITILRFNYAYAFRKIINTLNNGDELTLNISNIKDAAGNLSENYKKAKIKIDYSNDTKGPNWYDNQFSNNVLYHNNLDGVQYKKTLLTPTSNTHAKTQILTASTHNKYLIVSLRKRKASIEKTCNWNLTKYPCLAFRVWIAKSTTTMTIKLTDKKTAKEYKITLSKPYKNEKWKPRAWNRIQLNITHALIKNNAKIDKKLLQNLTISNIKISIEKNKRKLKYICFDDFFIFNPSPANNKKTIYTWDAFDASGIKNIELSCIDQNENILWTKKFTKNKIDLATLPKDQLTPNSWLRCRVQDKAGNFSSNCWIPFPKQNK